MCDVLLLVKSPNLNVMGGFVKDPGHRVMVNLWCVADAGERKTAPTAGGRRRL